MTILLAIPMSIACIAYSRMVLSKKYYRIPNDEGEVVEMPYQEPDYDNAFSMESSDLPGTFASFLPLLVPIILILINTVATALGKTTGAMEILVFLELTNRGSRTWISGSNLWLRQGLRQTYCNF